MNKKQQKLAALVIAATIGGSALLPFHAFAATTAQLSEQVAVREMVKLHVLDGYADG
ncbi:MAG: hypothetical protein K0Q59_5103, partial [Paenibacillus sp.]|nr:hypothetical protein [Paenibacillus sp.]